MNLIVNADKNWGIGKNNELLVHIPNDMKMFRQMTTGKVVVMGRKTLESFPNGMPLPKRTNIVLTHDKDYDAKGAIVVGSKEELLDELEEYKDEDIYLEACTHSSYANEHHREMGDNERLEFMGDSVLQIWSATQLFLMEPKMREGQMTTLRAQTVCESTLAVLNRQLGWYEFLRLGVGEEKTGGRHRESILADQFEACIGAIYIDQGYAVCDEILTKYMKPVFKQEKSEAVTDYKTHLQEVIQADSRKTIQYKLLEEKGPSNAPTFTMGVYLDDILLGQGTSSTKKKAEQKAAKDAFEKMAK